MRDEMNSIDVMALVECLSFLVGGRIDKVYQISDREFKITIHVAGRGTQVLYARIGKYLTITTRPKLSPERPTTRAMFLRSRLAGARIEEISQIDTDRIVVFRLRRREDEYRLIFELFRDGNLILTDRDWRIIFALERREWRHRRIDIGERYEPPPSRIDLRRCSKEDLGRALSESGRKDLVRALVSIGLPPLYAEEICARTGIEKDTPIDEIPKILDRLYDSLADLIREAVEGRGYIYYDEEGNPFDFSPVRLEIYSDRAFEEKESFLEVLDDYFHMVERSLEERKLRENLEREIDKLEATLEDLRKRRIELGEEAEKYRKIGDKIFEKYELLSRLLDLLRRARDEGIEEKDVVERSRGLVRELKLRDDKPRAIIDLDGVEVELRIDWDLVRNASEYYERAKKLEEKLSGVERAIEDIESRIRDLRERLSSVRVEERFSERPRKRRRWFENFRWCITSDGLLVIGGKDARTNELVVKRYMGKEDLYFHADIHGAPHVILKRDGKEITERSIREAAEFAAIYSNAWKWGLYGIDVFYVRPEQVSEKAPSGEYLPRGSFMIYGKKNYVRGVEMRAAIGVVDIDGERKVMCGPVSAVSSRSKKYVVIEPGEEDRNELAKTIRDILDEDISIEDILRILPPGGSRIVEVVERK